MISHLYDIDTLVEYNLVLSFVNLTSAEKTYLSFSLSLPHSQRPFPTATLLKVSRYAASSSLLFSSRYMYSLRKSLILHP